MVESILDLRMEARVERWKARKGCDFDEKDDLSFLWKKLLPESDISRGERRGLSAVNRALINAAFYHYESKHAKES